MPTDSHRHYIELTSEQMFDLLASLPEDIEGDHDLAKRAACRWLLRAQAELHYTTQAGGEKMDYVTIRDICITGVGLLSKNPIPEGTSGYLVLPMEDGEYKVACRVAHCTQTIGGWRVGCQLFLADAIQMVPMVDISATLDQETFERNAR